MKNNNLIIDGNGLAYSTVFSNYQNEILGKDGKNYSSLIRVLKRIREYSKSLNADKVWFTLDKQLDSSGKTTNYRKTLLTEYKSNRKDDARKAQVYDILNHVVEFCKVLGIPVIQPCFMEADDVIYYLCKTLEGKKTVLTVDEDLLQLIDEDVSVFLFQKKKIVNHENFTINTKLENVDQFIKFKAVKGDVSDNIDGLDDYGPVKSKNAVFNWEEWFPKQSIENQEKILKNVELIDLSKTKIHCPDEERSYLEQMKNISCKFDQKEFTRLSNSLKIDNHISSKSFIWKEVFDKKNDLDELEILYALTAI